MGRLLEQDGFTLRLDRVETAGTAGHDERQFIRVALVRRATLFGRQFNVRETRAQAAGIPDAVPRALGDGRLLAWRWQSLRDARALLTHRLETLQGLGYEVVERSKGSRGEWDWLRELVQQRLRPSSDSAPAANPRSGVEALEDALHRLGLDPEEVVAGLAELVGLTPAEVTRPSSEAIARCEDAHLGVLLPFLLEHDQPGLRAIGQRWLAIPSVVYDVEPWILAEWATGDSALSRALVRRIHREGLALFGVEGLKTLATAPRRDVRDAARRWLDRVGAPQAAAATPPSATVRRR